MVAEQFQCRDKSEFSMDEVVEHNTKQDCWIVIKGSVYDVTEFAPSHPGGQAIYSMGGRVCTPSLVDETALVLDPLDVLDLEMKPMSLGFTFYSVNFDMFRCRTLRMCLLHSTMAEPGAN